MDNFNRNSKNRERRRDFNKREFFGAGRDRERPQMHETICSNCGKRCEVPFRPTGQKPVYCIECFRNYERGGGGFEKSSRQRDSFQFHGKREDGFGKEEFDRLIARLDTIISILTAKNGAGETAKEVKKSIPEKTKKKAFEKKFASKK